MIIVIIKILITIEIITIYNNTNNEIVIIITLKGYYEIFNFYK